jgi:hypothetical protein
LFHVPQCTRDRGFVVRSHPPGLPAWLLKRSNKSARHVVAVARFTEGVRAAPDAPQLGYELHRSFTITAGSPNVTGLYRIESTASVYPSVAGAEAALLYYANGVKRSTPKEKTKALPSSAKLGSEARIYSLRYYNGNLDTDLYSVVWRHGTIVGVVAGEGEAATVDPKTVIALAQKEQTRINQVA